jgi:FK506-binding protein 1
MGVTKEILREGDGTNFPKKGDKLSMHYKGTLASDGTQVQ